MRIESVKPQHAQRLRQEGRLRVNNIDFTFIEGRLISDTVAEGVGMLFDGQRGFNLLRDDLSIIRPAYQPPGRTSIDVNGPAASTAIAGALITPGGDEQPPAAPQDAPQDPPAGGEPPADPSAQTDPPADVPPADPPGDLDPARLEEINMHTVKVLRAAAAGLEPPVPTRDLNKDELVAALARHERTTGTPVALPDA